MLRAALLSIVSLCFGVVALTNLIHGQGRDLA
jgi:hypothetical protein